MKLLIALNDIKYVCKNLISYYRNLHYKVIQYTALIEHISDKAKLVGIKEVNIFIIFTVIEWKIL